MAVHGGSNDAALPNIAADDVAGVKYQVVKLDLGAAGVSAPVSGAIPVSQPGLSGGILQSVTIVTGAPPVSTIATVSKAAAAVVTTTTNHGLRSGETVTIAGGNSTVSIDGARVVTVTGPTTFTVPVDTSGGASAGTAGTVATVATPLTPLAGRAAELIRADRKNTAIVYVGSGTVTADDTATGGMDLAPGESMPYPMGAATVLYARSTIASQLVRVLDGAA